MSQQRIDSTTNKACPHKTTNNNNIITPGASSVSLSPSTPWLTSRPVPSSFSPSPVVASHDSHCVVRWSTTTNHPRAPRAITTLALYLPLVHISSCSSIQHRHHQQQQQHNKFSSSSAPLVVGCALLVRSWNTILLII